MSKTTENLGLFKYDPSTDGAQTFNIEKSLNENWDKIDAAVLLALAAAAPYSAKTYALGAYCTRGGRLYRCTTAITAAETWTAGHWTETTVTAELIAHATSKSNPHGVTAAQTGAYSKGETDTLLANKISNPIIIPDGTDLDSLTEPGFYYAPYVPNSANRPIGVCNTFGLIVERTDAWGGGRVQTACDFYDGRKYVRAKYYDETGAWGEWRKIPFSFEVVSKSGDTVNGDLYLGNKKTIVKPHAVGSSFWSLLNDGDFSNSSVISM